MHIENLKNGKFKISFMRKENYKLGSSNCHFFKELVEKLNKDFGLTRFEYKYSKETPVNRFSKIDEDGGDGGVSFFENGSYEFTVDTDDGKMNYIFIRITNNSEKIKEILKNEGYKLLKIDDVKEITQNVVKEIKENFDFTDFQLIPTEFVKAEDLF